MVVPIVMDELDILLGCVPSRPQSILELGCGNAQMARRWLTREASHQYVGMEVDQVQHEKNLAQAQEGMQFVAGGAQAIPYEAAQFNLVLMLKSLHHVPSDLMDTALQEVARVLKPAGHLYVSEPVYDGPFNDIIKIFNDEGVVRAQAQAAVNHALSTGAWEQVAEKRFDMPVHFENFEVFEQRMMRPTFRDHSHLTTELIERARHAFMPHMRETGAHLLRPMHVRCLRRRS